MRTYDLVALRASNSALLATAFGASSTRWRSTFVGVTRVNSFRLTLEFLGSITLPISFCQPSGWSIHPRLFDVS